MDISDRVKKIIEYYGYSPSEFADIIDVARSSISHITSGRNKASLDFVIKIKNRFPEIRWDWLIEGQGEMIVSKDEQIDKNSHYEQNEDYTKNTNTSGNDLFSNLSKDNLITTKETELPENSEKISENTYKKSNVKQIILFFDDGKFEVFTP